MKKTTILAHSVPFSEIVYAFQSAEVLKKFGITLVILTREAHVDAFLLDDGKDPRCQIRRLQ